MVDYRPIPDQREVFHEYRSYAFRPDEGRPAYDPGEHDTPRALRGARRGLYAAEDDADDDPRCVCRHYWLEAGVRGDRHPTAGLASVATPPEYRRSGYVGQLLAHSLEEYRDRGCRFSVLWPFKYRFYRQYGWETSNRIATHECDPSVLAFATDAFDRESGSFRRLEPDDYAALKPVYTAHADRHALALERDEEWWRHRVFGGHGVDPFVAAYERDGRVRGYLVYTIDDDASRTMAGEELPRTMAVSELAFVDHEAFLALLSFCHTHDSQVQRVRFRAPPDGPLLESARDPDEIETTLETGPMVRLVDVADTLSALSYPGSDASVTIAVEDPVADWNDGTFALEVADGNGTCERLHDDPAAASVTADVDVRIDIAALSRLVVGSQSASALERTGRLEALDTDAVATLEALFPATSVYLGEFF
ncbi:GNAT family N-acetyltransferase [Halopiger djelfimassiliensis]|uniref:GNAT family N-acetyltransferase n=1 Tax=Halopiger djelfimassiliensis TaxID=1293047 RepID=UPI0006777FCC|nr:GNAT family N-acetyltransferase [Halopiger djelfimassiliensis]